MTTVPPAELIESLAADVRRAQGDAEVELMVFPSGAADLGVRMAGRYITIVYSTLHRAYGVDELTADDDGGFDDGYRFVFHEFAPAAEKFRTLMANAPSSAPVSPSQ